MNPLITVEQCHRIHRLVDSGATYREVQSIFTLAYRRYSLTTVWRHYNGKCGCHHREVINALKSEIDAQDLPQILGLLRRWRKEDDVRRAR